MSDDMELVKRLRESLPAYDLNIEATSAIERLTAQVALEQGTADRMMRERDEARGEAARLRDMLALEDEAKGND